MRFWLPETDETALWHRSKRHWCREFESIWDGQRWQSLRPSAPVKSRSNTFAKCKSRQMRRKFPFALPFDIPIDSLLHFLIWKSVFFACNIEKDSCMPPANSNVQNQLFVGYQCNGCKRFYESEVGYLRHRTHFARRGTKCAEPTQRIEITASERAGLGTAVIRRIPHIPEHPCESFLSQMRTRDLDQPIERDSMKRARNAHGVQTPIRDIVEMRPCQHFKGSQG